MTEHDPLPTAEDGWDALAIARLRTFERVYNRLPRQVTPTR